MWAYSKKILFLEYWDISAVIFPFQNTKKSPIKSFVQLNFFVFDGNIEKKTFKPCNSAPYMSYRSEGETNLATWPV